MASPRPLLKSARKTSLCLKWEGRTRFIQIYGLTQKGGLPIDASDLLLRDHSTDKGLEAFSELMERLGGSPLSDTPVFEHGNILALQCKYLKSELETLMLSPRTFSIRLLALWRIIDPLRAE